MIINREMRRRRLVDRLFNKKGYRKGRLISGYYKSRRKK